jgi:hypothetical protein
LNFGKLIPEALVKKRKNMFSKILLPVVLLASLQSLAQSENFKCNLFGENVHDGYFSMSGENPMEQDYKISVISDRKTEPKDFSGKMYLQGKMKFTDLDMDIQSRLTSAMNSSRRAGLVTGDLVVFGNTKDGNESTFKALMMPSGEIAFIQLGFLEMLCM